jgi:hypothetical protein
MNPARVKAQQKRTRYFAKVYRGARTDAIRDTEALLAVLKRGGDLRRVHFAAYDAHMTAALLYSHAAWLAEARKNEADMKAGRRRSRARSLSGKLGWPDPSAIYNARRARSGEAQS